jgi:hypothetical protein
MKTRSDRSLVHDLCELIAAVDLHAAESHPARLLDMTRRDFGMDSWRRIDSPISTIHLSPATELSNLQSERLLQDVRGFAKADGWDSISS